MIGKENLDPGSIFTHSRIVFKNDSNAGVGTGRTVNYTYSDGSEKDIRVLNEKTAEQLERWSQDHKDELAEEQQS